MRGEEQLLVSEEATASGAVTISPTDMDGNAVTLTNDTEQVSFSTSAVIYSSHRFYYPLFLTELNTSTLCKSATSDDNLTPSVCFLFNCLEVTVAFEVV